MNLFNFLMVRLRFVFIFVAVGLVVFYWPAITNVVDRATRPSKAPDGVTGEFEWYCPMHPSVIRADDSEKCPICGMPLSKRKVGETTPLPPGVLASVSLTPARVRQAGISTVEIGYRPLMREIRTVGVLKMDERRLWDVTARVEGRIEALHANYVGAPLVAGEPMMEIYSPPMLTSVTELRLSVGRPGMADAARTRLRLWGLTDEMIAHIETSDDPMERIPIPSPVTGIVIVKSVHEGHYLQAGEHIFEVADLSRLWMEAEIFERDIGLVRVGQSVIVTTESHEGESFTGQVSLVYPSVRADTRTVRVRVDLENDDGRLKPDMYVSAVLHVPLGRRAEVSYGC